MYRRADKPLARPGRKKAREHVRDARDLNKIETRAVIRLLFLQGKALKEIHAILTETLACFLPGRAKDLSAPCNNNNNNNNNNRVSDSRKCRPSVLGCYTFVHSDMHCHEMRRR